MYLLAAVAAFCACAIYYNPTHLVEPANALPVLLLRYAIETADALDPHLKMVNRNLFETLLCLLKEDPPQLTLTREITTVTSGLKAAHAALLYELNVS